MRISFIYLGGSDFPKVAVPAGTHKLVRVPVKAECAVSRIVVRQDDDDAQTFAFSVAVYNRPVAPADTAFDPNVVEIAPSAVMYEFLPATSAIAGAAWKYDSDYGGKYFRNTNGTYTVPDSSIYVLIAPVDADIDTNWHVAVTADVTP